MSRQPQWKHSPGLSTRSTEDSVSPGLKPPYFDVSPTHKARTWLLDPRAPKVEPPEAIRKLKQLGGNAVGNE